RCIDNIVRDPNGVPNGKGKRTQLTIARAKMLRSELVAAFGYASIWACHGSLPNRTPGRGRPPDNAIFIFIDDIVRAIRAVRLTPGFRYVAPESLPVALYQTLAPLLWRSSATAPRRVFERWARHRDNLKRA